MRYMLRNTVRDPETLALRTQNRSRVQLRPMIGGSPLPPGSSRLFRLSEFTTGLLAEIDRFSFIGNVRLYCVGKAGGIADTNVIRRLLRFPVAASPVGQSSPPPPSSSPALSAQEALAAPSPVLEEVSAPPSLPVETLTVPVLEPIVEAHLAAEPVVEAPVEVSVEPPVEEAPKTGTATPREEELGAMKLTELRDLLASLGGKPSGKNKPVLVDEILEMERV